MTDDKKNDRPTAELIQFADPEKPMVFPDGEWSGEPNELKWTSAEGYPCEMVRNYFGAWCGYVEIPDGHPVCGLGWDDQPVKDLEVHGGITYAARCKNSGRWVLGFDCAHFQDMVPGHITSGLYPNDEFEILPGVYRRYRNLEYARANTNSLAEQLSSLATVVTVISLADHRDRNG